MKKRLMAMVLTLAMCLMVVPATAISVMAAQPSYTTSATKLFKTDSKTKEITLATGIKAKSFTKLTRTHIAAILTKVMNSGTKATDYKATNVTTANKDVIAKAIAMGIFSKTSAFSSTKQATRQEAVAALLKTFQAKGSNFEAWESVSDANKVPKATRALFAYFANKEIIDLSDNTFNPTGSITVGEFMKMVDDLAGDIITKKGTYTKLGNGSVTVATKDVVLNKVNVKKNLTIADGVGKGDVTLKDTKVTGRTVVRGGGSNSIKILGTSSVKDLVIECANSDVRIFADGSQVKTITINDGKSDVIIEATIENLTVNTDTPVEIKSDVKNVTVVAKNAKVTVAKDATVETVNVEKTASGTSVDVKGTVATVTTEAPKSEIKGDGTVTNVEVKADDIKIDTVGTKVTVGDGVKGTTSNGTDVAGGTNGTTTDEGVIPETPPVIPPSGGGGGVVETPADYTAGNLSDLKEKITLAKVGQIIEITSDLEITETIVVDKAITIRGKNGVIISTSGKNPVFHLTDSATIESLSIEKTDNEEQQLITGTANNIKINNCTFTGIYVLGDPQITRAICLNAGVTGFVISNNAFSNLRQPGYLEGAGTINNNTVKNTRGFVVCMDHKMTFSGNKFENNAVDIAVIENGVTSEQNDNYKNIAQISAANNGAFVENQRTKTGAVNGAETTMVKTLEELTAALEVENTNVKSILVCTDIGTANSFGTYNVTRPVLIHGTGGATVYGSFVVTEDGANFESLAIENKYVVGNESSSKNGINAYANNLTVTNCRFTTASPAVGFEPNGVVLFPKTAEATLNVTGSTFAGFNKFSEDKAYYSAGIFIAEDYPMANKTFFEDVMGNSAKLTTPTDVSLSANTFTDCAYGYVRMGGYAIGAAGETGAGQKVRYAWVVSDNLEVNDAKDNAIKYAEQGAIIFYNGVQIIADSTVDSITSPTIASWYGEENAKLLDTSICINFDRIKAADITEIKFELMDEGSLIGTRISNGENLVRLLKDCGQYWDLTEDTYLNATGIRALSCAFKTRKSEEDNGFWVSTICTTDPNAVPSGLQVSVTVNGQTIVVKK